MRILGFLILIGALMQMGAMLDESEAADPEPDLPIGTQEVGLSAGYLLPHRLTRHHTTKQKGPALMPSWGMVLTDPIGETWYRGQVTLGAEVVYIVFLEPVVNHGIGFTPRMKYSFTALNRLRPYLELAAGPFWTDFTTRVPEQSSRFNFIVTTGIGVGWFLTANTALNIGYRFHHISNGGTSMPNWGLNSSLPFAGFSVFY